MSWKKCIYCSFRNTFIVDNRLSISSNHLVLILIIVYSVIFSVVDFLILNYNLDINHTNIIYTSIDSVLVTCSKSILRFFIRKISTYIARWDLTISILLNKSNYINSLINSLLVSNFILFTSISCTIIISTTAIKYDIILFKWIKYWITQ